jgi:hypothetical protein
VVIVNCECSLVAEFGYQHREGAAIDVSVLGARTVGQHTARNLHPRPERSGLVPFPARGPHRPGARLRSFGEDGADEAGFPHAGFTTDEDEFTVPARSIVEGCRELGSFPRPADER